MKKVRFYLSLLFLSVFLFFGNGVSVFAQMTAKYAGTMGYLEHLPPDYTTNTTKKYPVIIFLHGTGEKGDGTPTALNKLYYGGPPKEIKKGHKMCFTVAGVEECFIVIAPQLPTTQTGWFENSLNKIFDHVLKGPDNYRYDPQRIYLTGLSLGGGGVYKGLVLPNDIFAAGAVIAGFDNSGACTISARKIPMWGFHGENDATIAYSTGLTQFQRTIKCTNPAPTEEYKWTNYPGVGHNSWDRAFATTYTYHNPNLYEWLLTKRKTTLPVADAGVDQIIISPTSTATLTGKANGIIPTYLWQKISGPAVTLKNATTIKPSLTGLVEGVYTFRFTITDQLGNAASDEVEVIVQGAGVNASPLITLSATQTLTLPTNSTNITATASDTDGTVATYLWTQQSGSAATLSGTNGATLSASGLVQGGYIFRLTVTDDDGASSFKEITVTVNPAATNVTPTSLAGVDKVVNLPTSSTNLTGSGIDTDGTIVTYLWEKFSGSTAVLENSNTATLTVKSLVAGIYTFRLTVTDDDGATAFDDVKVTVVAANVTPLANAGADQTITLPTSSTSLSGSGSDSDGSITTYLWSQLSGPSTSTITSGTSAAATATNLVAGVYTFRLTVTDNSGATGTDDVKVTVNAAPVNNPPLANAGVDRTTTLPTNTLVLTGSGTDSDGTIASYNWTKLSGSTAVLTNANTSALTISGLVAGSYSFQLTVTDNAGATATDVVLVTVQPEVVNQAPVANAGVDKTVTLPGNSITLNGTGTDADGSIATYSWTKASGPAATLSGANTVTLQLSDLLAGVYTFRLTVMDNKGASHFDEVNITVNAANIVPTSLAGVDKVVNLPTSSINLTGSGIDTDGTIVTYLWEKFSGSTAVLENSNTATLTVKSLVAGIYTFRLTVTDDDGATAFDDVKVTVVAANITPLANAGADKTITLPTNSTSLSGSGSDSDGSITAYLWSQLSGPSTSTITSGTSAAATATNLVAGVYTFRLTVTDNSGATGTDDVKVTVNAAPVNNPPLANAGVDRTTTLPTNTLVLTGSGTDSDGTIVSYNWTKLSGSTAVLTNANTSALTISGLVAGSYSFQLRVTDNAGATATDVVLVTVQPELVNQAPVANAGIDKTITLPGNSITLNGTGTDADGSIATYSWTKASGPAATLSGASTVTLLLSDLLQGVYTFRLTVTDNKGASHFDEVKVTVNAANIAPTALAGADVSITLSVSVNSATITGSGLDVDGTITTYSWAQVSGPATALLTNQNTNVLTISNLIEGVYVFRLTVTDDDGASGIDEIKVTVNELNQAPLANAGSNKLITLPTNSINLTGAGTDADGTIVSYAWSQFSGPTAVLTNQANAVVSIVVPSAGIYVFRLTVTDDDGGTGYDDVTLTVNAATVNQAPIVSAGANQTITLPVNSVELNGIGSDSDGSIVSYQWIKVGGATATLTNETTANLSLSNLVDATYVFRLTVTDDDGASTSDEVTVNVFPQAVNQPPVAQAGGDKTLTLPTNLITLNGGGSDSDGTVASYSWTKISGPAATVQNATTANLSLFDLTEGKYVFRLTVTDDKSATGSDDVTITVNTAAVNQLPVANAGTDQTVNLPNSSINLTGSGSDADGGIVGYKWEKLSGPSALLANTTSAVVTIEGLVEGSYSFRLTVTDNQGASDQDDVIVQVFAATVNQGPAVDAGADGSILLPINTIKLTGSAFDPDGSIATYKWTKVSGGAATLTGDNTSILTLTNLVQGTYTFRLTATDDKGATGSDDVVVVVNPAGTNQAPVANAGANQTITLPVNSVELNGIGSDTDGSIVSYQWIKVGGATATLTNETTANLSLSNLVDATYVFRLTVTDDDGASTSDEVTVNVFPQAVNQPPVAQAGGDKTLTLPINLITLNGGGSDSDGTVASYAWTKISGPAATVQNATTANLSLFDLTEGKYVFRLTVTDDKSATGSDDVTITVNTAAVNQLPVANAGTDQTVNLPNSSINLTGSGSDADGGIVSYQWEKLSGPSALLANTTSPVVTIEDLVEGSYSFRLTVTDNQGASDQDDVIVQVFAATVNQGPEVDAGEDGSIILPINTIKLTGSAFDPDGSIAAYKWTKVSGGAATLTGDNTSILTLTNLVQGTYTFRLTATDDKGATGSDDVVVVVNPVGTNQAPVANAGNNLSIQLPVNSVTIRGTGTDADGTIASYLWEKLSGPAATLTNVTTQNVAVSGMVQGSYIFRLTVTDNGGLKDTDEVNVTVLSQNVNVNPVANAGTDVSITLPANSTIISGVGTDKDGTITAYNWSKVSGPQASESGTSTAVLSLTSLVEGTYVYRFTVTDSKGGTGSDNVSIMVYSEKNNVLPEDKTTPTVDAGQDTTLYVGTAQFQLVGNYVDLVEVNQLRWTQVEGNPVLPELVDNDTLTFNNLPKGSYVFEFTATNTFGNSAYDQVTVTVIDVSVNYKKYFSPNGDGINDLWELDPEIEKFTDCPLVIFDSQGTRLLSTDSYQNDWNGMYRGGSLPEDVYYFVLDYKGTQKTGTIMLIR